MSCNLTFVIKQHTKITNWRTMKIVSVIMEKSIIKQRTIYH